MTILTGRKLEEASLAIWGADWASILATAVGRTRKTIYRWRDGNPPADMREPIILAMEDRVQLGWRHVNELRASDDEF